MDVGSVIQGSRGDLLAELSRHPQSPKELAGRMKTSVSNIIQQLAILEANGLVDKKREQARGPGKPKTRYSLKQDFMYAAIYRSRGHIRKHIPLAHADLLTTLNHHASLFDKDDSYYFLKFIYSHEDLIRSAESMALIKVPGQAIELLVITENLEPFRKQFANNLIKRPGGGEKKVIIWSHSRFEIEDGLNRKDHYFTNYIGRIDPLYDSTGIFNLLVK